MSKETYASRNLTEVHTDVLSEARQACYKVILFPWFLLSSLFPFSWPFWNTLRWIKSGFFFLEFCNLNFFPSLKARDAFYACLEKESVKKPTEITPVGLLYPSECNASRAEYVKLCRSSWVKLNPILDFLIWVLILLLLICYLGFDYFTLKRLWFWVIVFFFFFFFGCYWVWILLVWNVCGFGLWDFVVVIGRWTISIDSTVGTEGFRGFWMIETREEVRCFFHSLILSSPPILDLFSFDYSNFCVSLEIE